MRGKAAARRSKGGANSVTDFLDRVHIDIIGPVDADVLGNKYLFVARDEWADWPFVMPMKDRQAATAKKALLLFHAGQR